jgi:hypothetical protein
VEPSPTEYYTAAQIARALGRNRQAVLESLKPIPPDGKIVASGNLASAWGFHSLPELWRAKIWKLTRRGGYRSPDETLKAGERWKPITPLAEIGARWIEKATQLQRALEPSLARLNDPAIKAGDVEARGIREYAVVFGHEISPRHWRRLMARTIERDRGNNEFGRVEIYLDERGIVTPAPSAPKKNSYRFPELDEIAGQLRDRTRPSPEQKETLLAQAFKSFEQLHAAHPEDEREIKVTLLEFLLSRVPGVSKSMDSLRWTFNKNYRKWIEGSRKPAAIEDGRTVPKARPYRFQADAIIVARLARDYEGNFAAAYGAAQERLSEEFQKKHPYDPRKNKSRLPKVFLQAVEAEYLFMKAASEGPKSERDALPRPTRDWSMVLPGDQFEADDLTVNFYWIAPNLNGLLIPQRGECLCMADRKSRKILDFLLIADHYNSEDICALMLRVHDRFGLPRLSYVFENGPWAARLIKPDKRKEAIDWSRAERGLANEGIQIEHEDEDLQTGPQACGVKVQTALPGNARTKIIEGIFNSIQNPMAAFPGFVGRNERRDHYDRNQSLIAKARSGHQPSQDKLFTFAETVSALEELFWRYNNTPQNGEMLEGRTPEEAWSEQIKASPLKKLAPEARWIMASRRTNVTPRSTGIHATIRGKKRIFASHQTAELPRNQKVSALYNIERPDEITILHNGEALLVPELRMPAIGATRDDFNRVKAVQGAYREAGRRRFSEVRTNVISTITRDGEHEEAREIGRQINAATERADEVRRQENVKLSSISRKLTESGRKFDRTVITDPADFLEAIELEKAGWAELEKIEQQGEQ